MSHVDMRKLAPSELKRNLIRHMRRLSMLPNRVRSFLHRWTVRCAA